ncbi:MAG: AlpA family transcriptional regulator [Gallionella sp.]
METNTSNTPTTLEQLQTALIRRKETALIRRKEVERLTALSRSRIYELMSKGKFPKPVSLGSMSVAWVLREVESWIDERIAERGGMQ